MHQARSRGGSHLLKIIGEREKESRYCFSPCKRVLPFSLSLVCLFLSLSACATAPARPVATPTIGPAQKFEWILQMEDQRVLSLPQPAPVAGAQPRRRGAPAAPPAPTRDLAALATDPDAHVRHRAALAIGRVGLKEGLPPLTKLLGDVEPTVRQIAAFAM